MCGIVGGYGDIEPQVARRMMGRIAHRGPDDDGLVQVAGNTLGHRRLSIVDVEGGKQPLRYMEASVDHRALEAGSQTPYGRFGFVVHGVINFTPGKDVLPIKDHRLLQQDA